MNDLNPTNEWMLESTLLVVVPIYPITMCPMILLQASNYRANTNSSWHLQQYGTDVPNVDKTSLNDSCQSEALPKESKSKSYLISALAASHLLCALLVDRDDAYHWVASVDSALQPQHTCWGLYRKNLPSMSTQLIPTLIGTMPDNWLTELQHCRDKLLPHCCCWVSCRFSTLATGVAEAAMAKVMTARMFWASILIVVWSLMLKIFGSMLRYTVFVVDGVFVWRWVFIQSIHRGRRRLYI